MSRHIWKVLLPLFVLSAVLIPAGGAFDVQAASVQESDLSAQEPVGNSQEGLSLVSLTDNKKNLEPYQKKISSSLLFLVDEEYVSEEMFITNLLECMETSGQIKESPDLYSREAIAKTEVYVYIKLKESFDLDDLNQRLISVVNYDKQAGLIAAWIDVRYLEDVASFEGVKNIMEVIPPLVNTGSVLSEGDSVLRADLARSSYSLDGSGIKIGVLSDGVNSIDEAKASGDLPADVNVLSDNFGGDEGTAMLEIIHDLAPGAELYFHDCGSNSIAFRAAIDDLVAVGCNIIVDDISWITQPFFEDGENAAHIDSIINNNDVLYVTSAGNYAMEHYQGMFYDQGDSYHDFSHDADALDENLYVDIDNGETIRIILQWNESFFAAESDYDLYLMDGINVLDYSDFDNIDDEISKEGSAIYFEPIEWIEYTNDTGDDITNAEIKVKHYAGDANDILEVFIYGTVSGGLTNIVPEDSIYGHAAVPGVVTCGAIPYYAPTSIEDFSSLGPVTMLSETRDKPDICATDGVSVSGAGGWDTTFFGTSASAPHVAAIAALTMERYPSLAADEVKEKLVDQAVDLGASGFDYTYGYGRIDSLNIAGGYKNVDFDSRGGSLVPTNVIETGTPVPEPDEPTRSGYDFGGWYSDYERTNLYNFSTAVNSDMTLYAGWDDNSCTVTFNSNGGSAVSSQNVSIGSKATKPSEPTRSGYIFSGWYTNSGLSDKYDFATPVSEDITLYAKWIYFNNPFRDVSSSSWYYYPVGYTYVNDLIKGTSPNTFAPNIPTTRAMIVTILWRSEGEPSAPASSFRDLTQDWYRTAVNWAALEGIVNGYSATQYAPNDNITREQMVTILYRYSDTYKGYDVSATTSLVSFPDASKVSSWAVDAMKWAVAEGYINGSDGKLMPRGEATRAQLATVLYRYLEDVQ